MPSANNSHWMRDRPELVAMIVQFNLLPASSIHPRRAAQWVDEKTYHQIAQTGRGQRRLSEALRKWMQPQPPEYYEFQPLRRRFALLESSVLERLMTFTGAALLGRHLARIICREQRRVVRENLGEDVFNFAVKRSVLGTADLSVDPPPQFNGDSVTQVGWEQLERCFAGEPSALTQRLTWKLPPEVDLDFRIDEGPIDESPNAKERLAMLMRRVLVTEVKPELASCFT